MAGLKVERMEPDPKAITHRELWEIAGRNGKFTYTEAEEDYWGDGYITAKGFWQAMNMGELDPNPVYFEIKDGKVYFGDRVFEKHVMPLTRQYLAVWAEDKAQAAEKVEEFATDMGLFNLI